jgi:hypothetical protein
VRKATSTMAKEERGLRRDLHLVLVHNQSSSIALSRTTIFSDAPFSWICTDTHSVTDSDDVHTRSARVTNRVGLDLQISCDDSRIWTMRLWF